MTLPELVSVDDLFVPPTRAGAVISPDGTRVAYLAPWRNRLNVWVRPVDSDWSLSDEHDPDARCVTADEVRSVVSFRWTDDRRWLIYTQDSGGDENDHLFRVDLDGTGDDPDRPGAAAVDLTPFPGARVVSWELPPGRPGTAFVQLNAREIDKVDLHALDVASGELTMLARNPGSVAGWFPTADGEVFGYRLTDGDDVEIVHWDTAAQQADRRVALIDGMDHPYGVPVAQVTPDGTGIWLASYRDRDLGQLVRVDLATGERSVVDAHPELDVGGPLLTTSALILHSVTGTLLGVRYLGARQTIHALDTDFAAVLPALEALSDGDLALVSCDEKARRWVVAFTHDREPGVTWLHDRETGESRRLFSPFPHRDPADLAPMTPVTITARDGLALPSYLTLPLGIEPVGLPLVLQVHGGPWFRDAWGFDPEVQLLANRGHAVLQVNFRGSIGYGATHTQAAIGEFAGAMHDDLIDAVEWAVAQGYADRARVAISGGSYGGYAALVGVTFTPEVFAAAVDVVGISDLANFMRSLPPFVRPHLATNWYRYVGDPSDPEQEADMRARSPITRVEAIRTPLLVAQGANDVRVVAAESDNIVGSLRARGVDVEYIVKHDEGHGFLNPENAIDLYRAIDRFLARHLGGRTGRDADVDVGRKSEVFGTDDR